MMMNFWIMGGLMGLGLFSILGLVAVVMGEQRSQQMLPQQPEQLARTELLTQATVAAPPMANEAHSGGQVRELSAQLRALYRQTQELEQHLYRLAEQVQRQAGGEESA
jgi:hypothetical protein